MNIYDWDIVYINTIDNINKQLKNSMNDKKTAFTYEDEATMLVLNFDFWEIVHGGSGKLLRVKTPVKDGKLTLKNKGLDMVVDGICPLLEIQLKFLEDYKFKNIKKLIFNLLLVGEKEGDQNEGAVTLINADLNNVLRSKVYSEVCYGILSKILVLMIIENKQKITHIFAKLNMSSDISWMNPMQYIYSYYSPTYDNQKGFLVIYSVVTDRNISNLNLQIDGSILDNDNDTFLLLSERLFLEHIIMPQLPKSFGNGATEECFRFDQTANTSGQIKNTRELSCQTVSWAATYYYPRLIDVNIKVIGNNINMTASGRCDITGLADSYITFNIESNNTFYYNKESNKIEFKNSDHPIVNYEKYIPWWVWAISSIGGGLVVLIVDSVIESITNTVAQSVIKNIKINADDYIENLSIDIVQWDGIDKVHVTECDLDVLFAIKAKA